MFEFNLDLRTRGIFVNATFTDSFYIFRRQRVQNLFRADSIDQRHECVVFHKHKFSYRLDTFVTFDESAGIAKQSAAHIVFVHKIRVLGVQCVSF